MSRLGRLAAPLQDARLLVRLPWRVARFVVRARRLALQVGDHTAWTDSAPLTTLGLLVRAGRGRRQVVEIGTSAGWTAAALALADRERHVTSYDPAVHPHRDRYLALLAARDRARISLVARRGEEAQAEPGVELLFLDGSHRRDETIAAFRRWEPALAPGALVAFHDYGHPDYAGVAEAVAELGLEGRLHVDAPASGAGTYVWVKPR